MSDLLKNIDERTKLAGTNKLEILMFSLGKNLKTGREETFGINVFKVREVMKTPLLTVAPSMPPAVEGMVSLRGILVPVVDLAKFANFSCEGERDVMIVTEYNGHVQGFLVESVDTILRLDWGKMKVPPDMLQAEMGGLVTAVTELPDGRLVMMLDVERVLADTAGDSKDMEFNNIQQISESVGTVFFADDSSVARGQIEKTLKALGVNYFSATNGRRAWEELDKVATSAVSAKLPVKDRIALILTDVEMPEMDGYILTKKIKTDPRFNGIPVIMHSSLSGASNQTLGKSVGVDAYVSKFEPVRLAEMLRKYLQK